MTAKIINLARARKDRNRAEARQIADENAAKHGRTKAERKRQEAEAARQSDTLDAHQREGDMPDEP